MKKILPIILLALIIPQIALASWWNPLSWKIFHRADTKTQILENRVKELEKKLEDTTTSTSATTTTNKQPQATKVSEKKIANTTQKQNVNEVSSKVMIDTIDTWIKNSKSFSDSINEYIATIDYYSGTASKSNESASTLINTETDQYLLSMWQYLSKITEAVMQISASLKSGTEFMGSVPSLSVPNLTSSVNNYIAGLVKKRSEIPEYYANNEIFKAEFKKLIDYQYASYGKVRGQIYDAQDEYLDIVGLSMSKISDTQPDIQAYMSRNKPSSINIVNNNIYRPSVVVPQIQIPKTTYCDMHETTARGFYSITCN